MGLISDRFGRKTIIIWMSLVHIGASFLTSFSKTYPMFVGTRFFKSPLASSLYSRAVRAGRLICELLADMHWPKVEIVLFWQATRCGFPKNWSKKPKVTVK